MKQLCTANEHEAVKQRSYLLTFISFVASFKTLFTILSSSFLLGFFSILRYKLICNQEEFYML